VDQWTQMITVTGAKGLASNPTCHPGNLRRTWLMATIPLPEFFQLGQRLRWKIGGYEGFAVVLSCGTSPLTVGKSESVLLNVIKEIATTTRSMG